MSSSLIRPLRRVITKKFGGYRRFLLVLACLALILYTLKSLFVGDGRQISFSLFSGRQVWDVKSAPTNKSGQCDVKCQPHQLSFYIRTGEKTVDSGREPIICFQGELYMSHEQNNIGRGFNTILVDSKTMTVKAVRVFDTYVDDSQLLRFLKKDAKDDDIILLATFDDASNSLKGAGRHWLTLYGSTLINQLGYRENFIMIGHRGLAKGSAIEYYVGRNDKVDSFAPGIEKAGCFSFPLGKKVNLEDVMPDVLKAADMKIGERHDNCGLPHPCPEGSVAVAVDTGQGNLRQPSICVDGHVRLDGNTNSAGRGFNIVILDPETLQPSRLTHLDTYNYDSIDLELFLETLQPNEIIIAVIADDASKKLGQSARDLLNKLGSGHIQNLRFRDVWYFVGQKGIDGFSKLEQLSFSTFDGGWPKPLTNKFCVPKSVPSSPIMIDTEYKRNDQRREFCVKYDGYTEFCNPAYVDEDLKAIPVATKELQGHKIFETPLIIVPGMNHNAYVHTLQTALMQPGINIDNVAVLWDEKLPEYGELATMFGFRNYSLDSSISYAEQLIKAMKFSRIAYPTAEHLIIVEEDLLLAPDFMPFMAHCLGVIKTDNSLAGAFAWNVNGFESVSGNSSRIYRVQDFPGLGFLMKSSILQKLIDTWGNCCKDRAWSGWKVDMPGLEMLMPDVSRVYRTLFYGAEASSDLARTLFLAPRKTVLEVDPPKLDLQHLMATQYEEFLQAQIHHSHLLAPSELVDCIKGKAPPPSLETLEKGPVVIYYNQTSTNDQGLLVKLCRCFGLVTLDNIQPKNLHNGLLRFYYQGHDMFLVGSMTSYFDRLTSSELVLTPAVLGT